MTEAAVRVGMGDSAEGQRIQTSALRVTRAALLNLPLDAYKQYQERVEHGFVQAAKFLHTLHIYRIFDLPYQSQVVALAAIGLGGLALRGLALAGAKAGTWRVRLLVVEEALGRETGWPCRMRSK